MIYVRDGVSIVCQDGSAIETHKTPDGRMIVRMKCSCDRGSQSHMYIQEFDDMDSLSRYLDEIVEKLRVNNTVLFANQ